ncbi:hypothetical protein C8R46DRAFT_916637, partial [Mycena filopes]
HPNWYVRAIIYMVALLHTRHRVTFYAARLILICLAFLLSSVLGVNIVMPRTLKTAFARLDIRDQFVIHPVCYQCHHIFDPNISPNTFCPDCDTEVFGAPVQDDDEEFENASGSDADSADTPASQSTKKKKPYLVAPNQLLSVGLQEFFKRPGMTSAVNAWKTRSRATGELNSMQDAEVWKTIKGSDGESFFFGRGNEEEIRLGVSFSLDCDTSLNSFRYRAENLILTGMPPGPTEQTAEQLQHYLKIVVDDLVMLHEKGIIVKTPEYPNGKCEYLM